MSRRYFPVAQRAAQAGQHLCRTYTAKAQAPPIQVGATYTCKRIFATEEVKAFLALTGDTNQIHTSYEAARAVGLQGTILPGMLCASLFPAIIGKEFPGALYLSQTLKFRQPAPIGAELNASVHAAKVSSGKVLFNTVCTADGKVIVVGTALALLKHV